jgi:hypothetical protein
LTGELGIPRVERWIGRILLRRWCRQHPPSETMALVRSHQAELAELFEQAGSQATRCVRIPRLPGLEENSTAYSIVMVIDHVARVNLGIARVLSDLTAHRPHQVTIRTVDFKPSPETSPEVAWVDLEYSTSALEQALSNLSAISTTPSKHPQPWFGPLPARVWACFPTFHTALHLKQARLIRDGLPPINAAPATPQH